MRYEESDLMLQACNPIIWEAEARESQIQGQPEPHRESLSPKKRTRGQRKWEVREGEAGTGEREVERGGERGG